MTEDIDLLLAEQIAYYRERAPEYDEIYLRKGRYDHGPDFNERWFRETGVLERWVDELELGGRPVLELACGTGLWTRLIAQHGANLTAVDAVAEVIEQNRARVNDPAVRYLEADLFEWEPDDRYDTIFFAFWLSHVPPDRFAEFWGRLATWLRPGGRVALIDDLYTLDRPFTGYQADGDPGFAIRRQLNDGREFRIVKTFFLPDELTAKLADIGWDAELRSSGEFFIFGTATPGS